MRTQNQNWRDYHLILSATLQFGALLWVVLTAANMERSMDSPKFLSFVFRAGEPPLPLAHPSAPLISHAIDWNSKRWDQVVHNPAFLWTVDWMCWWWLFLESHLRSESWRRCVSGMPARNTYFELSSPSNVYFLFPYVYHFFHVMCTNGRCMNRVSSGRPSLIQCVVTVVYKDSRWSFCVGP